MSNGRIPGLGTAQLIDEMNAAVQIPGLSNLWVQPIRNCIDMLSTGAVLPAAYLLLHRRELRRFPP